MTLSLSTFIPLAVFFAITLGVWAALSLVADRPINADERLKRVLNPNAARPDSSALSRQQDMLQAKFAEAAKRLGKSLKPSDEADAGQDAARRCSTPDSATRTRWRSSTA